MELAEQVGFGKGKCLVQEVQEFVRPRDFVKEEGACVLEKVVTGILLAFRIDDNDNNSNNNNKCPIPAPLSTFQYTRAVTLNTWCTVGKYTVTEKCFVSETVLF